MPKFAGVYARSPVFGAFYGECHTCFVIATAWYSIVDKAYAVVWHRFDAFSEHFDHQTIVHDTETWRASAHQAGARSDVAG